MQNYYQPQQQNNYPSDLFCKYNPDCNDGNPVFAKKTSKIGKDFWVCEHPNHPRKPNGWFETNFLKFDSDTMGQINQEKQQQNRYNPPMNNNNNHQQFQCFTCKKKDDEIANLRIQIHELEGELNKLDPKQFDALNNII